MRKSMLGVLLCSLAQVPCGAQQRYDPVAASGGGAWLREGGDAWVTFGAAPLLSEVPGLRAGAAYFPAPWGLGPLGGSAAVIALPFGTGGIGASVSRFGYALYSETALGAAYGGRAGALLAGAALRVMHVAAGRYGSAGIFSADAAVVVVAAPWMRWGIRVTDLNRPAVGGTGERLRETAGVAALLGPPGGARLMAEVCRDDLGMLSVRAGVAYEGKPLAARIGASGAFDRIHCGIGVSSGTISVGYGVVAHPELGWSHFLWLGIEGGP